MEAYVAPSRVTLLARGAVRVLEGAGPDRAAGPLPHLPPVRRAAFLAEAARAG